MVHALAFKNTVRAQLYFNSDEKKRINVPYREYQTINNTSYELDEYILYSTLLHKMDTFLELDQKFDYFLKENFFS